MTEKMKNRCRRAALATMMSLAVGAFNAGANLASRAAEGYQAAIEAGAAATATAQDTADAAAGGAAKEAQPAAYAQAELAA